MPELTIPLRGDFATSDERLDRLIQDDPRNRDYPVRSLLPGRSRRGRSWYCPQRLDQQREGACVGFSITHEYGARPKSHVVEDDMARKLYRRAQQLDPWPDDTPYEGTSVLAGAKAAVEAGWYEEYRWAGAFDDVLDSIVQLGPVVLGLAWLDSMFDTDRNGLLDCSGSFAGGHAILARGYAPKHRLGPVVSLHQSWGEDWGIAGRALIRVADLEERYADGGECMVPVLRR